MISPEVCILIQVVIIGVLGGAFLISNLIELKQSKKRYMNIDDIKFEKEKLLKVIENSIIDFENNTQCRVNISTERERSVTRLPYQMPEIEYKLKIHIDVLL